MGFTTDKQTLIDLNILGRYKHNSIFSLFNHTITIGGGRWLEKLFNHPLNDVKAINERKSVFEFFERLNVSLPFSSKEFIEVENYLRNLESKNRVIAAFNITKSRFLNLLINDKTYPTFQEGLEKTIDVFSKLKPVIESIQKEAKNTAYEDKSISMLNLLNDRRLSLAYESLNERPLKFKNVFKLDYIFRGLMHKEISQFLKDIHELDVYIAVSNVSRERNFVYANAVEKEQKFIDLKGVYHPCVPNAIANDIYIGDEKKVMFLTGANMAGKSTFMKAFSVAAYLAHMGFPVAAKSMDFSIHDGIYTSINVPDNLAMGYSHFYAEVMRVKHVAKEVASKKQLIIIFDELFKGTNVKDAYDGTVSIVDAFSRKNGLFIISTHIMEAGLYLQKNNDKLFYKFFPTIVKGTVPTYPYILEDGITDDRQGMMIIENEQIVDIIRGKVAVN